MSNSTNATTTFCVGDVDTEGWQSNHCRVENGLWHFAQLLFCVGYLFAMLRVAENVRRYYKMEVYRIFMVLGSIFAFIWAASIARAPDQMAYYIIFFVINLTQLIWGTWYTIRRITFADHLNKLRKRLFNKNCYNLERIDFYNLVQEKAFLKTFKRGQSYIKEHDVPGSLAILLSGKMHIYKTDDFQRKQLLMSHHTMHQQQKVEDSKKQMSYMGTVYPYEFINSYEWLSMQGISHHITGNSDTTSQVEIKVPNWPEGHKASDEGEEDFSQVQILEWGFAVLDSVFKEHPRLRTCIYALVGKDIAEKMLRITGHSIYEIDPAVDMVRRNTETKCSWEVIKEGRCFGNRADTREAKDKNTKGYCKRSISMYDDEHLLGEVDGKDDAGKDVKVQTFMRNLTYVQERAKDALGAGPWCDLPDDVLLKAPWTNLLFSDVDKEKLSSYPTLNFSEDDENNRVFKNRVWAGVPVMENAAQGSFQDDKPFLLKTRDVEDVEDTGPEEPVIPGQPTKRHVTRKEPVPLEDCFETERTNKINVYGFPTQESDAHHHLLNQEKFTLQKQRLRCANARLLGLPPAPLESMNASSDSSLTAMMFQSSLLEYFEKTMKDLKKKDREEILKWGKWRTFYRPETTLQRQGEEANYIGVVLQGKLAAYTVDELTASKSLAHYIETFHLFGSEDFSSKFRTARRTIEMPKYEEPPEDEAEDKELPQQLHDKVAKSTHQNMLGNRCVMYERMTLQDARRHAETASMLSEDKDYLINKIEQMEKDSEDKDSATILVTKVPTVMFVWDIRDLKRLMLADPHVESCLSILLRGDITYKLSNATEDSLGTRVCGFHTQARGDGDVRVCGP